MKYVSNNTWWLIIISHQPQMMTLVRYFVVALNKVQYATHLRKPYFGALFFSSCLFLSSITRLKCPVFQHNDFPSSLLIYKHTSSVYTTLHHIVRSSFMYYSCVRTFVNCESKTKQHPQTRKPLYPYHIFKIKIDTNDLTMFFAPLNKNEIEIFQWGFGSYFSGWQLEIGDKSSLCSCTLFSALFVYNLA